MISLFKIVLQPDFFFHIFGFCHGLIPHFLFGQNSIEEYTHVCCTLPTGLHPVTRKPCKLCLHKWRLNGKIVELNGEIVHCHVWLPGVNITPLSPFSLWRRCKSLHSAPCVDFVMDWSLGLKDWTWTVFMLGEGLGRFMEDYDIW